ncbi:MAG: hypothetical protein ABSF43_05995 [Rectinemataceae bacterium]|jgi:hypothetical protein
MAGFAQRFTIGLSERLATTWVLLSDTTNFLSRTSVFNQYELQLRDLRFRLSNSKNDDRELHDIKKELIELRAGLRLQGYDLSLGALDLSIKGFRNDAAMAEGFKRIVLFIGTRDLWFITGEENHRVLHDYLESECERKRSIDIRQKHYLWFRWNHSLLLISGADSETADDFEELKAWGEKPENRLALLGKLKKVR